MAHHPIRVLIVSKAFVVGTYQTKLEELAAHPDIELTAIVPPQWGHQPLDRAFTNGYRLLVEPVRFNGNFHMHHYPTLAQRIAALNPHIVHIDEEPYNLATYLALRAAKRHGAKALFFSWQNINRSYPPPFSWMERWVLKNIDYAILGNTEAVEVWHAKGYNGPHAVIPQFGVDPALFSPIGHRPENNAFIIGFAGRVVEEKGLDNLIRALVRFEGRWRLRILGKGPRIDDLQTLAGLWNHGGSVQFEETIPSTTMPNWYRQLDLFVLPSVTRPNWKEQFGRVLIEAMACGIPVLGSDSGAIPEVIGEAGMIFPEGDETALLQTITALYEKPQFRQKLAELGRKRVLAHFTQSQIAAETIKVYRQLMRG